MRVTIVAIMRCPTCGGDPAREDLMGGPSGQPVAMPGCDRCGRSNPVAAWLVPQQISEYPDDGQAH